MAATLIAIKYEEGCLKILDQLLLPQSFVYVDIKDTADAWNAIKDMKVWIINRLFFFSERLFKFTTYFFLLPK